MDHARLGAGRSGAPLSFPIACRIAGCASSRVVLLCAAFARLACNPAVLEYHKRSGTRIWNWYLYAYGIASFCLIGGRAALRTATGESSSNAAGPPLLGSLGVILVFLLLNIEIADYFSIGPTLTFSFSGNFARDMTYSIAWALFALGSHYRRHANQASASLVMRASRCSA